MKKQCKTCKSWEIYTKEFDVKYHGENIGKCRNEHFVYIGDGDKCPVNGLGYWDYESYAGGFETGAKFGCVHWASRKTKA